MQETTNQEWAEVLSAEPLPPEQNPIRKLMLGFLDPSEMTPEERMDELASILAAGFLHLKGGMSLPTHHQECVDSIGQTSGRDHVQTQRGLDGLPSLPRQVWQAAGELEGRRQGA